MCESEAGIKPHFINTCDGIYLQSFEGDRKYLKAMAGICRHLQATPNI
jgi:hypothetical protein